MPKEYGTPGPRAIYPDICTSRSIAACSIEAQLLFDRLIAQCDDQGRVEGDAPIVKSLCVPLIDRITTRVIPRLLAELESEDLVHTYVVGRSTLTQVLTWWRWQQGMRRAYPSRWPAPEGWTDAIYGLGGDFHAAYKAWLNAAPRGTVPHNAAFRGDSPHNGALSRAQAPVRAPAAAALSGADSGALTEPDSPNPRTAGTTGRRANGTNPRAVAERDRTARHRRVQQRELAYYRGEITEAQLSEMNHRDAPLDELPRRADEPAADLEFVG